MRIIYLADIRLPTEKAHGRQIMETCRALAAAGHEVTLAASSFRFKGEASVFDHYGMKRTFAVVAVATPGLVRFGAAGFIVRSLIYAMNVRRAFELGSFDAIYTRDEATAAFLSKGRRLIYEMHDVRKGIFQRLALERAAGIVTISRGLADHCKASGIPEARIAVVPDAVDIAAFQIKESKEECRMKLGLPNGKKIALYSGHLYSWKGADVLAQAAGHIGEGAVAAFIGGTDGDIEGFKGKHGDSDRVIIAGRKPHDLVPYYLKAADVLVLPNSAKEDISRLYTSPLKLFEYMASGTPIVASDLPSIREILDDDMAIMVRPDDPAALAQGIRRAFDGMASAEAMAARAKKEAARYSWEGRASEITSFIEDVALKPSAKDTAFYDKESASYSAKRYPEKSYQYTHSFFKKRADIAMGLIRRAMKGMARPSLLEVGCADGVILERVYEAFGAAISSYSGIDASPGMISAAKKRLAGLPMALEVREPGAGFGLGKRDIIVEIGVLNYSGFEADIGYAASSLVDGGYYICSVAGRGSLWDRFRRSGTGFKDFMHYREYERSLGRSFDIMQIRPVGLFIPLIWRVPGAARAIQPVVEAILRLFIPNLFHEKVYLLRKKARA